MNENNYYNLILRNKTKYAHIYSNFAFYKYINQYEKTTQYYRLKAPLELKTRGDRYFRILKLEQSIDLISKLLDTQVTEHNKPIH